MIFNIFAKFFNILPFQIIKDVCCFSEHALSNLNDCFDFIKDDCRCESEIRHSGDHDVECTES